MTIPFFSIIIPTYNSEAFITKCLESVLTQNFLLFEVIVIDGASIDHTPIIVREIQTSNPSIIFHSEKDNGVYDAMNKGIKMAIGKWIYFLGSDDTLYDQNVLRNIFDDVTNCNCDVIYGNVLTSKTQKIYNGEFTKDMLFNQNICHQSIFLKKSLFKKIGIFNLKYKICADWDSNFKWFYNNSIKHKYYNIIVANFSEGGISTSTIDNPFQNDRLGLIIKYGYKSLPLNTIIHLAEIAHSDSKSQRNYLGALKYLFYILSFKFFRKVKNFFWFKILYEN